MGRKARTGSIPVSGTTYQWLASAHPISYCTLNLLSPGFTPGSISSFFQCDAALVDRLMQMTPDEMQVAHRGLDGAVPRIFEAVTISTPARRRRLAPVCRKVCHEASLMPVFLNIRLK